MIEESYSTQADFIIDFIARLGINHVFYLPGGGCMYLIDSLARSKSIKGIPLLHEQSVGIAAEAYSQFLNQISVCIVTTGPGATNAITPCAAAWTDSTPILFISGQVKSQDSAEKLQVRQLGFQEVPITQIVKPITKMAIKLEEEMELDAVLVELTKTAVSGRPGPVWLDIPLDLQSKFFCGTKSRVEIGFNKNANSMLDNKRVIDMVEVWKNAKRPLLLVGNGVRLSNQDSQVKRLIKQTRTPALLTWKMIDFLDEQDPLNAGRPGSIGQRWANIVQQNCDFLLCLGSRLDLGQVAYRIENFATSAKKFICEVDPFEITKLPPSFESFNVDLSHFLEVLNPIVMTCSEWGTNSRDWPRRISVLKENFPLKPSHQVREESGVNLYHLIDKLSESMCNDDILVPGSSGACSEVVMQAFKVKLGQRVLNSEGLGPMGFGLPAAIGVAFAADDKRIISVDGDGGFLMNIQELASLAKHKLPIVIFLLNNEGYGSIKSTQIAYFEGRLMGSNPQSGLGLPDWRRLIEGFSIDYYLIENYRQLHDFFEDFESVNTPCVIEVIVDHQQVTEPRVSSRKLPNGELKTDDMQDMTPKLAPEILQSIEVFLRSNDGYDFQRE